MLENHNFEIARPHSDPPLLTLVVPVYNERATVAAFIDAINSVIKKEPTLEAVEDTCEIIFVDDGSTDETPVVLRELCRRNRHVKIISLSRNFGKESALSAGLQASSGQAVVPMDVDLQDSPDLLVPMIRKWQAGAKIVNAKRIDRTSDTVLKRMSAHMFYRLVNKLADRPIDDNVGDFRLLDRDAVDVLNRLTEHSRFNKGLFSWIGFRTETVEYCRAARNQGHSKWKMSGLINLALDGITSTTTLPLRIWSLVGALMATLAFLYAVALVAHTLITGGNTPGYASIMVAILFLGGLNLLSLGLMGEYIGRIAVQVRNRPLYVIASKEGF